MPTWNIDEYVIAMEKGMLEGLILEESQKAVDNANVKYQNANHAKWVAKHKVHPSPNDTITLEEYNKAMKGSFENKPAASAKVVDEVKEGGMFEVLPLAKEFYTVEALVMLYQDKEVTKSQYSALMKYRKKLHESMRYLFRDYILVSCFGEARHGGSASKMYIPECAPNNKLVRTRIDAGQLALEFSVESISKKVYKLFAEGGWSSGYGGERWAKAIKAMELYDNAAVFLDHVFDLKHNGSSLFNKTDYEILNISSVDQLKSYLNKRFSGTPEELVETYMVGVVSEQCLPFIKAVHPNKKRLTYDLSALLDYKPLQFGTRTLSDPKTPESSVCSCQGCSSAFFRVNNFEEYCYDCLEKDNKKQHIMSCVYCQGAYNLYHPDNPIPIQPKLPIDEPKVAPKESKNNVKDEQRHQKDAGKQEQIVIQLTAKGHGGKSAGKQTKGKIKWQDGSTDWTNVISVKPSSG